MSNVHHDIAMMAVETYVKLNSEAYKGKSAAEIAEKLTEMYTNCLNASIRRINEISHKEIS